ncbi:MAG: signal peptidase II, partial [Clostridia bacterium]|nr:signal peptidase II [Clostridia bacterium]
MYFWIVIAALVIAVDQLTKLLIVGNFSLTDHFTFIPGIIDIVYVQNKGAAFSMLENFTWFLGLVSVLFSVAIAVYMLKTKPTDKLTIISAGLLLGGAVGNGIDRIFREYVVDFIELVFFNFPVFN